MILCNFKEEYSKAMQELPEFHMDAGQVRSKAHYAGMVKARRRKMLIPAVSAACVFLLCSVGTAVAMNYQSSRIEVERNGFSFLGQGSNTVDEGARRTAKDAAYEAGLQSAAREAAPEDEMQGAAKGTVPDAGTQGAVTEAVTDELEVARIVAEVEDTDVTYDSIEDFKSCEDMIIAIPEVEWLGDPDALEEQHVTVNQIHVMVSLSFGEKTFFMSQADNREYPNYAFSSVFMGEAANERTLTSEQGMTYTLFDSVEGNEVVSTHAALSANGRDIIYTFSGYKSEEVDAVLKQLDVSIYFREE